MELEYERQDGVDTNVYYMVKDPKHETEKPYTLNFDPGNEFPRTNVVNECKDIHVRNARTSQQKLEYRECGFAVFTLKSKLSPDDFYHDGKVTTTYYPECKKLLTDAFPDAARIELLQHNTRKRHETFPIATGTDYEYTQPTTLVHLDYTNQRVQEISQLELGIAPDQYSRVVAVNLWKPIRGPVHDWPLALCDARSVNHNYDTIAADIVERQWVSENMRLYHNSKHRWYYYEGLRDDEVILFRQSDSTIEGGGGVPHTGFPNPNAFEGAQPRESIELRAFVYFA